MKQAFFICRLMIIGIALCFFFFPSLLTPKGYELSVDGVVIARTICLIFALSSSLKLLNSLQQ